MHLYFRNEFDFWNVHGIMNTSGLLQSKLGPKPAINQMYVFHVVMNGCNNLKIH